MWLGRTDEHEVPIGEENVEQAAGIRKLASAVKRATSVSAARVHPNHHALMQHHFKRDG